MLDKNNESVSEDQVNISVVECIIIKFFCPRTRVANGIYTKTMFLCKRVRRALNSICDIDKNQSEGCF